MVVRSLCQERHACQRRDMVVRWGQMPVEKVAEVRGERHACRRGGREGGEVGADDEEIVPQARRNEMLAAGGRSDGAIQVLTLLRKAYSNSKKIKKK